MSDVAYRGCSTNTTTTVTAPAGITTGDLMIVQVIGTTAPTIPAGWVQLGATLGPIDTYYGKCAYRFRQGGDTTYTGWTDCLGWVLEAFYNVNTDTTFSASNFATYTTDKNIPLPSLTADAVAGDAALYLIQGTGFVTYTTSTYTERQDVGTSQTSGDRLSLTSSQTTSGTVVSGSTDQSFVLHAIIHSTNSGGRNPVSMGFDLR